MRTTALVLGMLMVAWVLGGLFAEPDPADRSPAATLAMPADRLASLALAADTAPRLASLRLDARGRLLDPLTDEPMTGRASDVWPDGTRRLAVELRDGLPHGGVIGFHPGGAVAFVRHHARGVPYGRVLEYDRDGGLRLDAIAGGRHPDGGARLEAVGGPFLEGKFERVGVGLRAAAFDWRRALADADLRDATFDRPVRLPKRRSVVLQ